MSYRIERFETSSITTDLLIAAANLFNSNYGVWGPLAAEKMGVKSVKHGDRINMSPRKLEEQILPMGADNVYVRVMYTPMTTIGPQSVGSVEPKDRLIGNVFGTRWRHEGRMITWITQLCVDSAYRSQGLAKKLLRALREGETEMGIMSSHPHAILAVRSIHGNSSDIMSLDMTKKHARGIIDTCPVHYVKTAKLHGCLFEHVTDGSVSCVDTNFWVDHTQTLEALKAMAKNGINWHLGTLPEGHEFLMIVRVIKEGDNSHAKRAGSGMTSD